MEPAGDIIASVAFSPDGRLLAAGTALGILHVWDVRSRRLLRAEDEGSGLDTAVSFSPDGKLLARATLNMTINLWDVATWRQVRVLQQYTRQVDSVAFSPDGKVLGAATSNHGPTILWGMGNARQIRTLGSDPSWPNTIAFSPDGSTVATGGWDGIVTLSEASSGRTLRTLSWRGNAPPTVLRPIDPIAFSPDGRILASSWEAKLKLWDVATGREIATLSGNLASSFAFSPDGKLFAWSDDKVAKFWDIAAEHEVGSLARPSLTPIAFLADGQLLAFDSDNGAIKLVDAASGRDLRTIGGHADSVPTVAISANGTMLAWADGNTVKLWDIATGQQLRALSHQYSIATLAFSPDGRWLASGSEDGTVQVWDLSSGKERVSLITFTDGSWLEITPEGYYDASSAAAEEHLNVRVGDRVFGIASYRDKFFRPDLVKLSLAGNSLRDLQFATIDSVKLAPVVELTNLPPTTTNPALTVNVHITDGGGGIGAVRLYVNGTAIVQDDAPASSAPGPGAATTRGYTVQLLGGVNELRAVAYNGDRSMQSNPATAKVVANLPPAPRGTLHAIVVGIQDFKNPKYNLSFSVADAELFAQTLREHSAPLFEHTDVKLLTSPADTTREGVTRALKETLADVGVNDVFVFYAASHGVIDDDGAYYLITSNVDSAEALKEQALSQTDLTLLLANIPAPKKLVVMDTCHGQPVGDTLAEALRTRGMTANTAAKIAARDIGLTVLAASTSDEEALEGYNKHGLFTYVVSDGLAGSADLAKRGIITNDALTLFVRDALPSLAANLYRHEQTSDGGDQRRCFCRGESEVIDQAISTLLAQTLHTAKTPKGHSLRHFGATQHRRGPGCATASPSRAPAAPARRSAG